MTERKNTSVASSTKHIHAGTAHYAALLDSNEFVDRPIPYIRLRGHWLAAAGFNPDDPIEVEVAQGRLVLSRR